MVTQRAANLWGFVIVLLMGFLLILVWFKLVPHAWYTAIFLLALLLFLVRVTLRLIVARQRRLEEAARRTNQAPPP